MQAAHTGQTNASAETGMPGNSARLVANPSQANGTDRRATRRKNSRGDREGSAGIALGYKDIGGLGRQERRADWQTEGREDLNTSLAPGVQVLPSSRPPSFRPLRLASFI